MTVYYIDISSFQAGINLSGWHAVAIKATQGTGYTDPYWSSFRMHAAGVGAFSFGYHFLEQGNGAGQADHYFAAVGKVPCMIDFEPTTGSNPTLADAEQFCDRLRGHGCPCNLVYLPRWYWGNLGSPSLSGLSARGLHLVSSDYVSYSDSGAGWQPYGGMSPAVWQYSSTMRTGGCADVDCNAYKGSFAQLAALVNGTPAPAPAPAPAPPHPVVVPAGDVVVPDSRGRNAGRAHDVITSAHLVPKAAAGQAPAEICTASVPVQGATVKGGSDVTIEAAAPPELQLNATGTWVVLAQIDLNRAGAGLKEDGDLGPATDAAVQHFQLSHGLADDGVIGPVTWRTLGSL